MTHAVITGAIRGEVTLDDGTVVDVRPGVVFVETAEQAAEVATKVGERYEAEGHPEHDPGEEFVVDKDLSATNLQELTKE